VAQPLDVEALQELVRAHRARTGLSLRLAAEEAEVPFNTLARVEKGHLPDLANFRRIVDWLGIEPERFFQPQRIRTENTVDVIAHHLARDPNLSSAAAERIAGLVQELYQNLARQEDRTRVHLRAASTFTPAAAGKLGDVLEAMQEELNRRFPSAG
jgi:transcriptional regulator with XRE-family HTH domain